VGNRRGAIRAVKSRPSEICIWKAVVKSARQHTTTAASEEGALARWTCSTPYWVRQRLPHPHQPRHWWMLNCPRICRPTLSVERNRRLNGGLPSTRCWPQKPSAISARRRRPWLVSTCLALLGGSTRTNGYFPSVRKKSNKNRGKNLDLDFFRFLAKNRDFRFRIRESSITKKIVILSYPTCIRHPVRGVPVGISPPRLVWKN